MLWDRRRLAGLLSYEQRRWSPLGEPGRLFSGGLILLITLGVG